MVRIKTEITSKGVVETLIKNDAPTIYSVAENVHVNTPWHTTNKINLWVSDADGKNSNSGLTNNKPLKDIASAYAKIPDKVNHAVVITLLGSPPGDGYVIPVLDKRLSAHVWVVSEEYNVLLTGSAAAGNTTSLTTTNLVVDEYRGKTIEILSGDAIGDRRTIRGNTTTMIQPVNSFTSAVAAADSFRVFQPATSASIESGLVTANNLGAIQDPYNADPARTPGLVFENLVFATENDFLARGSTVYFFGCVFTEQLMEFKGGSMFSAGFTQHEDALTVPAELTDRRTVASASWRGWGISTFQPGITGPRNSSFQGFQVGGRWTGYGGYNFLLGGGY